MHGWRLNASRNISLSATLSARASKVAGSCSRGLSQRRDAPRGPSSDSCAIHNYPSVIVTAILYVVLRTASNAGEWHVRLELFSGCNADILCIDGGHLGAKTQNVIGPSRPRPYPIRPPKGRMEGEMSIDE